MNGLKSTTSIGGVVTISYSTTATLSAPIFSPSRVHLLHRTRLFKHTPPAPRYVHTSFCLGTSHLTVVSPNKLEGTRDGIDARTDQDELVWIRKLDTDGLELALLLRFSTVEMRAIPENHCVPVVDHFQHPDDPSVTFIVSPYLRHSVSPPFECAEDVMDYMQQILEVGVLSC